MWVRVPPWAPPILEVFMKRVSDEEIKNLQINNDMANDIFQEIKEHLSMYHCMHDKNKPEHTDTTPMFFAQWIDCIISKARLQGIAAAHLHLFSPCPLTLEENKVIWDKYHKFMEENNEVERPV